MSELETLLVNLSHELDEIRCIIDVDKAQAKSRLEKLVTMITTTLEEA